MTRHFGIAGIAAAFGIVAAAASPALADCADLHRQIDAAFDQLAGVDYGDLLAAFGKIKDFELQLTDPTCSNEDIPNLQRRRAELELQRAMEAQKKGLAAAIWEPLISDADKPEVLWQAAQAVGDVALKAHRFADAQLAYERAINLLDDESKTKVDPPDSEKDTLDARANEAKMLANPDGQFVASATNTRNGSLGGVYSGFRGYLPPVFVPIQFDKASAKLTDTGIKAATELLAALQQQSPDEAVIEGHTDPRGSDAYNLQLSDERARAVAKFLTDNKYKGKITTVAKGESEPAEIYDPSLYTEEQIWAIDRRVVWVRRKPAKP